MAESTLAQPHTPPLFDALLGVGATGLGGLLVAGQLGHAGLNLWAQALLYAALVFTDVALVWRLRLLATRADEVRVAIFGSLSVFALLACFGPLGNSLFALTYVWLAVSAAALGPRASVAALISAASLETITQTLGHPVGLDAMDRGVWLVRMGLLGLSHVAPRLLFKTTLEVARSQGRRDFDHALTELEIQGEALALNQSADNSAWMLTEAGGASARRLAVAVRRCHSHHALLLSLLQRALAADALALVWRTTSGNFEVRASAGLSGHFSNVPFTPTRGILGNVVKRREPLHLRQIRPGSVAFHRPDAPAGSFLAAPIFADDTVVGLLCAERQSPKPFRGIDQEILVRAAPHFEETIESERVILDIERARHDLSQLFDASRDLARALSLHDVYKVAFDTAAQIVRFDLGALTLHRPSDDTHRVVHTRGEALEALDGLRFKGSTGLVATALKARHVLPAGGHFNAARTHLFTPTERLEGIDSLVILPMIVQDRAIGTLILGARRRGAFTESTIALLQVLVNQIAVALENGLMYRRMTALATTDGLTQLLNRRTFMERFQDALDRSTRHQRPLTLILTDIDHFKKVNDTHGHPVGDEVLRRVAKRMRQTMRRVDIVGRYGGEEFALVLENTSLSAGLETAERLRAAVKAETFRGAGGPFSVTLSLGVASVPGDGDRVEELIEHADQALYACKQAGRDCAKAWRAL